MIDILEHTSTKVFDSAQTDVVIINLSSLILEQKLELNGTTKRIDLLITEKTKPKILLELKAPNIALKEIHFEQVARYNSLLGAEQIIISNGLHHIFADYKDGKYQFLNAKV